MKRCLMILCMLLSLLGASGWAFDFPEEKSGYLYIGQTPVCKEKAKSSTKREHLVCLINPDIADQVQALFFHAECTGGNMNKFVEITDQGYIEIKDDGSEPVRIPLPVSENLVLWIPIFFRKSEVRFGSWTQEKSRLISTYIKVDNYAHGRAYVGIYAKERPSKDLPIIIATFSDTPTQQQVDKALDEYAKNRSTETSK